MSSRGSEGIRGWVLTILSVSISPKARVSSLGLATAIAGLGFWGGSGSFGLGLNFPQKFWGCAGRPVFVGLLKTTSIVKYKTYRTRKMWRAPTSENYRLA